MAELRNVDIDRTSEHRCWRLAEALIEFEHYARANWCSWEDPNAPETLDNLNYLPPVIDGRFGDAKRLVQQLASRIDEQLGDELRAAALLAMDVAHHEFLDAFHGPIRQSKLATLKGFEPEPHHDPWSWMLRGSPFESFIWRKMLTEVRRLIRTLPRSCRLSYQVADKLLREAFYRVSDGQARRRRMSYVDYVSNIVADRVDKAAAALAFEIPVLSNLPSEVRFEMYYHGTWDPRNYECSDYESRISRRSWRRVSVHSVSKEHVNDGCDESTNDLIRWLRYRGGNLEDVAILTNS